MDILAVLKERSDRNRELLARNKRHGDDLSKDRLVQFELVAHSEPRAREIK